MLVLYCGCSGGGGRGGGDRNKKDAGWNVTSFRRELLRQGGAVLCHPHDTVQLERMISVDCLQ